MKPLMKLLLPIALGCLAGFLNYVALSSKGAPTYYVATNTRLIAGVDRFSTENLERVPIYGNAKVQGVLWDERSVLEGLPVPRSLEKGDLLLMRDVALSNADLELQPGETALTVSLDRLNFEPALLRVGRQIGFVVEVIPAAPPLNDEGSFKEFSESVKPQSRVLGPFRIVSVGKATTAVPTRTAEEMSVMEFSKDITVATMLNENNQLTEDAALLVKASEETEILSVTFYSAPPAPTQKLASNE